MNIPQARILIDTISEKDRFDIVEFGAKNNMDFIALSFTQSKEDVLKCREILGAKSEFIKVIPKIENETGLKNLEEIISVSGGIMFARGDLGMELYPEQLFLVQKYCS